MATTTRIARGLTPSYKVLNMTLDETNCDVDKLA